MRSWQVYEALSEDDMRDDIMKRHGSPIRRFSAAAIVVAAIASLPSAAFAASDDHAKQDIAKHQQIAKAHEEAAQCVQGGKASSVCDAELKSACKGIAVGEHCGLRTKSSDYKDSARHIADHRAMVNAHSNAATCLAAGKPHGDCNKALAKDCAGLGVGKYCGLRHTH